MPPDAANARSRSRSASDATRTNAFSIAFVRCSGLRSGSRVSATKSAGIASSSAEQEQVDRPELGELDVVGLRAPQQVDPLEQGLECLARRSSGRRRLGALFEQRRTFAEPRRVRVREGPHRVRLPMGELAPNRATDERLDAHVERRRCCAGQPVPRETTAEPAPDRHVVEPAHRAPQEGLARLFRRRQNVVFDQVSSGNGRRGRIAARRQALGVSALANASTWPSGSSEYAATCPHERGPRALSSRAPADSART